jgi:hypothetical protein
MKQLIKQRLQEAINLELIENLMDEDYPSNFNIEEFKSLRDFAKRIRYCEEHLKRISSGSSRIVYKIDDEKVLKLAKNKKGLAQNEIESGHSQYQDLSDVTARVFAYDENGLWIEMELARKLTPSEFKRITGFQFKDYVAVIHNYGNDVHAGRKKGYNMPVDKAISAAMWENEFTYDVLQYIGNYELPVGDLERLNSYGIVKRNGHDAIVLIDYGLIADVYQSYYS